MLQMQRLFLYDTQLSSVKLVFLKFVTSNPSLLSVIEPNCDFLSDVLNLLLPLQIGDV